MVFEYATKRDINGNRYYLAIDTDKKIFAETSTHWFSREDIIEITKTDYRKLKENARQQGFEEWYTLDKKQVGSY